MTCVEIKFITIIIIIIIIINSKCFLTWAWSLLHVIITPEIQWSMRILEAAQTIEKLWTFTIVLKLFEYFILPILIGGDKSSPF